MTGEWAKHNTMVAHFREFWNQIAALTLVLFAGALSKMIKLASEAIVDSTYVFDRFQKQSEHVTLIFTRFSQLIFLLKTLLMYLLKVSAT